jgi:hypothetical protein
MQRLLSQLVLSFGEFDLLKSQRLTTSSEDKKGGKGPYRVSPHEGQVFCALGTLAPHSAQYFIEALLSLSFMPTDFSIDITACEGRF